MAYQPPIVEVFQEFSPTPSPAVAPTSAHISGGQAQLVRYSQAAEKLLGLLGAYDFTQNTPYEWPNLAVGGLVDLSYVQLNAEDGQLRYFEDLIGVGGLVTPVTGQPNQVRAASDTFKTTTVLGTTYSRSASLFDRDVQIGDLAYIRGVVDSVQYEVNTSVQGFVGDLTDASISSATADGNNAQNPAGFLVVPTLIAGPENCIAPTGSTSGYSGLVDGLTTDVYTVQVTKSSVGGDLTTARLRVTSASGKDNQSNVVPAPAGMPTSIGGDGVTFTFDYNRTSSCSADASEEEVSPDDLIAGQTWRFNAFQNYTPPTIASGGSYLGSAATTYIVQVILGGKFTDSAQPQITVSTTTGVDLSGPTTVIGSGVAVPVGTQGLTITFTGTALCGDDLFYITVDPAVNGALKTLILNDDLPPALAAATDLDLKLYIPFTGVISLDQTPTPPDVNYVPVAESITIQGAIELFDPTWTDNGVELPLPLEAATLYVTYRAWLPGLVGSVNSLTDPASVLAALGTVDPDNPLAFGVYAATLTSAGVPVFYTAVSDPTSLDAWVACLAAIRGLSTMYNLVPMTFLQSVQAAYQGQIDSESGPGVGLWKGGVFATTVPAVVSVVDMTDTTDGNPALATLAADPLAVGTQYTILSVPGANAQFQSNGVRAGDTVRYLFATDGFGNSTYTQFTVAAVLSQNTLRLATGNSASVSVARKVEVWRSLNNADLATRLAAACGAFADRRIVCLPMTTTQIGGVDCAGYFAAAQFAGLRAGNIPWQGLTNAAVTGMTGLGTPLTAFNADQYNTLAGSGALVLYQNSAGAFLVRHSITTDTTDIDHQLEMIRSNLDNISYGARAILNPYIGRSNTSPKVLVRIATSLDAYFASLESDDGSLTGPQLVSHTFPVVTQDPVFKDRVNIVTNLGLPVETDFIALHLVI